MMGKDETKRNLISPTIRALFLNLLERNVSQLFIRKLELAAITTAKGNAFSKAIFEKIISEYDVNS